MRRILIIEDDEAIRSLYAEALRQEGYAVVEAAHGSGGMAAAVRDAPDLILLDLGLPELDGWSAAELLKRGRDTAGVPIIAVTAAPYDEKRALHFDSFLTKPVPLRVLLSEVRRFAGPPAADPLAG